MTERAKELQEVKKQVLSLLVCLGAARDKPGIPVRQFNNDYRAMIGKSIPFHELGFPTLEEFFAHIKDTVSISWSRGEATVKAVENDTISHIVKLVDKQRSTAAVDRAKKKNRYGQQSYNNAPQNRYRIPPRRTPYGGAPGHYDVQPTGPSRWSSIMPRLGRLPKPWHPDNAQQNYGHVPERRPIGTNQNQPGETVNKNSAEVTQASVPHPTQKLILELLLSYPNGILGENLDAAFCKRFGQNLNPIAMGFKSMYQMCQTLTDIIVLDDLDDDFRIRQKPLKKTSLWDCKDRDVEVPQGPKKRSPFDEDEAKENVLQVVGGFPSGIRSSVFLHTYKDQIGTELPLTEMGFPSVIEYIAQLSDEIKIKRISASDWLLLPSSSKDPSSPPKSPSTTKPVKDEGNVPTPQTPVTPKAPAGNSPTPVARSTAGSTGKCPVKLQEAVSQVLANHPEGLPLYELAETFKAMIGKPLPHLQMGFTSLESFVHKLASDGVLDQEYRGEGLVLLKPPASKINVRQPIPSDTVGPGVHYTLQEYPQAEYCEVYVSHVDSPSRFWIQIKGKKTTLELEYLMDELEEVYYSADSHHYHMPDHMLTHGQVAAAIYPHDQNWHRVTIVDPSDPDFVQVYFVDYGTSCSVHKDNLRLLKSRFLQHPTQAIQATSPDIKPNNDTGEWSEAAVQLMLQLTQGRALIAQKVGVDKDRVLSVYLCDTNGSEDIHIQDRLVEEEHAVLDSALEDAVEYADETAGLETGPDLKEDVLAAQQEQSEVDDNFSLEPIPTCVKFVELTEGFSMHIISLDKKPYVLSSEISNFFWDRDLIRSVLRQKRIDVPRMVISKGEHGDLFDEFLFYGIHGVLDKDNELKSHLTIYELARVPEILDHLEHDSDELRQAVQREINAFDPDDPYWHGEDPSSIDSTSNTTREDMQVEDLSLALEALHMRRKHIVDVMVKTTDSMETEKNVERLQQIEQNIARVQRLIKSAKKKEADGKPESDEEFIQTCITKQYERAEVNPSKNEMNKCRTEPDGVNSTMAEASARFSPLGSIASNPAPGMTAMGDASTTSMCNMMASMGLGLPPLSVTATSGLTSAQEQFMAQYNLMLRQQMMQGQALAAGVGRGWGLTAPGLAYPGMGMMAPGMAMAARMPGLPMMDMSALMLGNRPGIPMPTQAPQQSSLSDPQKQNKQL